MKKLAILSLFMLLSCLLFISCGGSKKEARIIPLEDFFRKPEKISYKISPDGRYYSFLAPYQDRLNVFIQEVGSDEAVRITSETVRDIAGYYWGNNNRILYLRDTGGDENYQLYGVDVTGNDYIAYTEIPGVRTMVMDDLEHLDSLVLIVTNERNPRVFDPYRLNLYTGERELVYDNPGYIDRWGTDNKGNVRVAYVNDGVNSTILYRASEEEEFVPVITTDFKEDIYYGPFTPDDKYVYGYSNRGRDKLALVIMDPATAEEIEMVYENPKYDLYGMLYSNKKESPLAVSYRGHNNFSYHFLDKEMETVYRKIQDKFKGMDVNFTSHDKQENVWIIAVANSMNPGTYYVYDVAADDLTKITDIMLWIDPEEMGEVFPITYKTRDGLEIEAYLTLPAGMKFKDAKNLPVVVNPHGGPWARDYSGFNPEVQFLANRGYAVFQMNFRGSTGYGRQFKELSYGQWGLTMQDDITDGVLWLIEEGIADPGRIAIYGASYGGYATLAGIIKTPELYTCVVDYVGVSNLFTFMQSIPPYWESMLEQLYVQVGHPVRDSARLRETSPVFNVDKIIAPLFIIQGANDPRVNKAESDQMVEALKARGIDVQYMVKDDEGHGFSNQENTFEMYTALEEFLDEYMKPANHD